MTQEEFSLNRDLILNDLCARLHYGVVCNVTKDKDNRIGKLSIFDFLGKPHPDNDGKIYDHFIEPYLRSKSSMNEEEKKIYRSFQSRVDVGTDGCKMYEYFDTVKSIDYLYSIHVDVHDLIPKGLAIEASEEIYNRNK